MFLLVALACCVSLASASICCTPPQWEGQSSFVTALIHNGKASTAKGRVYWGYDSVNKKIGTYETISIAGSPAKTYGVLLDFNSNTKYMVEVTENQPNKCIKSALNRPEESFGACIPDDAVALNQGVMGFGDNDMNINGYAINMSSIMYNVAVTASGCVPVAEVVRGNIGGDMFIQNNFYFNITGGINDQASLQVPPMGCENAPMVSAHYASANFNPSVIGKRSFFL